VTKYVVVWQSGPNSAIDDVKELPNDLRTELFQLSREVLVEKPDPNLKDDEQSFPSPPFLMRRAARRQDMAALESRPDGHPTTPRTVKYWFVYRPLNASEVAQHGGYGFLVARLVDDLQLAWAFEQEAQQAAQTSP
jgi:hypothetical protein